MIYADGTKMCIGFPGHGLAHLVPGFTINQLSLEQQYDGLMTISLDILAAKSICMNVNDAAAMFASASSMSVNELLAAAFQKMNNRTL